MNSDLLKRRQKMLELHGKGLSLAETVKIVEEEFDVARRTLYHDWRNRKEWISSIVDLGDSETFFLEVVNSHREIYRMAVMEYLRCDNSSAKIGALRLLRELNLDLQEMIVTRDLQERVKRLEEEAEKQHQQ